MKYEPNGEFTIALALQTTQGSIVPSTFMPQAFALYRCRWCVKMIEVLPCPFSNTFNHRTRGAANRKNTQIEHMN